MERRLLTKTNTFKGSFLPYYSVSSRSIINSTKNVWTYTSKIVNLCYIKNAAGEIVMVDTGMPNDFQRIKKDFEKEFGKTKPVALILTHGHFDHVGSLAELLLEWQIPVYAHPQEMPYLTGKKDYPKGKFKKKGLVALLSKTFPNHGIDLTGYISRLPENGAVPFLEDWEWIHTPGHTPGHISLYNKKEKILIAGDAFVTTKQESLYHVLLQKFKISGPPAYFTPDWENARRSIEKLKHLQIAYCITGHGRVLKSEKLIGEQLNSLYSNLTKEPEC